jgi:spore coat protein SA
MIYHVFDERERFSEFSGGAISRWAANVLRNDVDTHIVCIDGDDSWGFEATRIHRVPELSRYAKLRGRRFYPGWVAGKLLRKIYSQRFPTLKAGDTVWVHGQPDIALALSPWARAAKAKLVLHLHGSIFVTHPKAKMRAVIRSVDHLVFCSQFLENEARQRFPEMSRTSILYNGADDALFFPGDSRKNEVPVVLVASRLVPEKGAHLLLPAMRVLDQRGVKAQAKILGSSFFGGAPPSPYVNRLHKEAPPNVIMAGYCAGKQLADEFRAADIFCLPAIYNDPFPLAVIEGMASGLPVVTTPRGGIPEALANGGGVFFNPDGTPEELASVLQALIEDPGQRLEIGRAGRLSYQKNFTWRNIHRGYHEILNAISLPQATICS